MSSAILKTNKETAPTHFGKITPQILQELENIVGKEYIFTDDKNRDTYSRDHTEDYSFLPDVVLKPRTPEEISQIMKICNEHVLPVTPRGGGTSLSGGALPTNHGVVISMERFNEIIEIDTLNLQATVETGVITEVFQNAVKEKNLFYPPDPASKGSCFIGGNVSHNSGGPKAVKYGVTRDYVLNLEVVLPTGEIIWTGANVLKNSTGYNLTQLITGSEGTLGIVTKIVFKLRPYPHKNIALLVPFESNEEACRAISAIYIAGITPSGMEFMEREAIERTMFYLEDKMNQKTNIDLPDNIQAHLIIELDGNNEESMMQDAEKIVETLENGFKIGEILFADSEAQKEELWRLRKNISPAVNAYSLTKAEDVVVPRGNLPELITSIKKIGNEYGFRSVCFGHVGDGNLHVNVLKEQISDEDWNTKVVEGIGEIFKEVVRLGGMLSGEHGIGIAKRPYMPIALGDVNLRLMREIKKVFDPNGILNAGKIF
ncbi:FAD-binding oxidoreductase [Bernardetia sp.]|uniref:FAD-binding oxidoreductase n=1 Tax=Bernardetia sp. TaxID=1937974 RepID=UPI0025BEC098|nr:FAD-linked oxidase C-terminal domain-containing protein [Bernardetia sp.]